MADSFPANDDAAEPTRTPILVLVTDGAIGDEDRILSRLRASLGTTTIHVVGIATAANAGLLARLADSSGGTHEIVESADRLDEVMDRIQDRLVAPLLTDVRVEGDGMEIVADSVVPARKPALFPGVPLVLRGRSRGTGRVTVTAREPDGRLWRIDVVPRAAAAPGAGVLWARARLRHLEDARILDEEDDETSLEKRIVSLSTGFGVLCRFTALVAIDPRTPDHPLGGEPRRVVQPVMAEVASFNYVLCQAEAYRERELAEYRCEARDRARAKHAPPGWSSPAPMDILPDLPDDPLEERAMVREILALLDPPSGRIDDVPPSMVALLLAEVEKVLGMLRARGSSAAVVAGIAPLAAAVRGLPSDRAALRALLEALADFADVPQEDRPCRSP